MRIATFIATACVAAGGLVTTSDAQAAIRKETNVPAQALETALQSFAKERDMQIIFRSTLVSAFRTSGVVGELTTDEALTRLLSGTGLTWRYLDSNTVAIVPLTSGSAGSAGERAPTAAASSDEPANDAKTSAEGEQSSPGFWSRFRLARATDSDADQPVKQSQVEEYTPSVVGLPEILVKGSKSLNTDIRRTKDDAQPYVVYDREVIERSNATTIEGFLKDRLPMNASGLSSSQRITSAGTQSTINLRGLGAGQTLILINGRRSVSGPALGGAPSQSPLNGIPLAAIERIEVLPTTASGIYGGSATGGVINVILRNDYTGTEVSAIYGNTFDSDSAYRRLEMSGGFDLEDGRTSILLSGSYSDQNALEVRDRQEFIDRFYDIARARAPTQLFPPANPPLGSTPNIRSVDGTNLRLKGGGTLSSSFTHVPAGFAGGSLAEKAAALTANAGQYDLGLADSAQFVSGGTKPIVQAPLLKSARASINRDFSTNLRAFVELSATSEKTRSGSSASGGTQIQPFTIAASAPNNPFDQAVLVTVPTDSTDSLLTTDTRTRNVVGGLVARLPGDWQGTAEYTWSRLRTSGLTPRAFNGSQTAALNTGVVDVFRDTTAFPVDLSSYLTGSGGVSPQNVTLHDAALRFAGPLVRLPTGMVTSTVLLEYRDEDFSESQLNSPPTVLLLPPRSQTVRSLYLESNIPLLPLSFRQKLELQVAARADKYKTVGTPANIAAGSGIAPNPSTNEVDSINPTFALRFQPFSALALRASYGTGFVPPGVTQLSSVINAALAGRVTDPLRGNATVELGPGMALSGGNADLKPEESTNLSMGLIWTPSQVEGLRVSVDYMRIKKTDNIATFPGGPQGLLNVESAFPDRVVRGARGANDPAGWAGPIQLIDVRLLNLAKAEVEAFDIQLDWSTATPIGTFGFSTVTSIQTHYKTQILATQPEVENVGIGFNNPLKVRGNAEINWRHRGWGAGWTASFFDSYLAADPALPTNAALLQMQGNGGRVPSQIYHNVFGSYRFEEPAMKLLAGTEIRASVRNVFNTLPPFDANAYFNLARYYHSPYGDSTLRSYYLTLTKRF